MQYCAPTGSRIPSSLSCNPWNFSPHHIPDLQGEGCGRPCDRGGNHQHEVCDHRSARYPGAGTADWCAGGHSEKACPGHHMVPRRISSQ